VSVDKQRVEKARMRKTLFILLILAENLSTFAHAAGPIIGPLCIDGVRATSHPDLAITRTDGVGIPTDYELDPAQARNARVMFFGRPITNSKKIESCLEISKRMIDAGAQLIVSGKLRALTLHAVNFSGPSGNWIEFTHDNFTATVWPVDSGARPVAGGSVDFREGGNSPLWIESPEDVVATADGITGEVAVEAWNRTIKGAQITIGQGVTFSSTLKPEKQGNFTFRVNLMNGLARLWSGNLIGVSASSASGDLRVPALTLKAAKLEAAHIGIVATNGTLKVVLTGLKGTANEVSVPGPQLQWGMKDASLSIDQADGSATEQPSMLSVEHASFRALSIAKSETALKSTSGSELFKGTAETNFALLSETERSAKSIWITVTSAALLPIFPGGLGRMEWNESGQTSNLTVNGKLETDRLELGGIDIGQSLSFAFGPSSLASDISIPVKVDLPAAAGSISFLNGDQNIGIKGSLERLVIDGNLVITPSNIDASRLDVASGKLLITVGSAISVSPVVVGAKPNFLDAKISVENDTDISISKAKSVGTALVKTSVLLLSQPVMQIGDNGTTNPATIDFKAEGAATLKYDLASGKSIIAKAKLTASDIKFSLLGPAPRILDLGGDRITDPTGTLKQISIEIDQLSMLKVESAELEALNVNASMVQKMRPPGTTTGLVYSGTPSKPLNVDSAHATRISAGDAIILGGWQIKGLDFAIGNDASIDFGEGISVAHASVGLHADEIYEVALGDRRFHVVHNGHVFASGKLVVHSPAMSINDAVETIVDLTLAGPEDALNGEGSLKFGTFSGSLRSPISIGFDCRGSGKLDVDMETNLVVGGGDFHAKMANGKLSADGAVGPIAALAHSTGRTGCDSPVTKHVIQEQGKYWTDGICNKGFEIYRCRWESPEISYAYHIHLGIELLTASFVMTNPHFYFGSGSQVGVCNIGAVAITDVVVLGGYSPGIDSPYPGLDNIVNGLIQIGFEPVQSVAATALGTGVGWALSAITTPAGNLFCIGKPL
jgi:hypothetical protein